MPIIDYNLWPTNAQALQTGKYKKKYFNQQQYVESKNPLEALVAPPDMDKFFGTKVCNIFIVGIPYGWKFSGDKWVEDWPPTGYEDALTHHQDTFKNFAKYETHVYMDMNIVKKIMEADSESNFAELMAGTKTRMQAMCAALADYGFVMESDIMGDVGPDYFYQLLDDFYKNA